MAWTHDNNSLDSISWELRKLVYSQTATCVIQLSAKLTIRGLYAPYSWNLIDGLVPLLLLPKVQTLFNPGQEIKNFIHNFLVRREEADSFNCQQQLKWSWKLIINTNILCSLCAYLPTCSISSEVAERSRKPSINVMESKLLVGSFQDSLHNKIFYWSH